MHQQDRQVVIVDAPLSMDAVVTHVSHPGAGAVVVMVGCVRDHTRKDGAVVSVHRLEYEAYAEQVEPRLAAASGGDTTDTGLVRLGGDIAEEGEFQALNEFARGENAARGFMDQAKATRARGAAAASAAPIKAVSTILDGGSSLFGKYAKGFA
jgi:hypothetical protein